MMKARQGRIINITSVVGYAGNPGRPTTAPPRPGGRHDPVPGPGTGSRNITVNCVAPASSPPT